MTTYAASTQDRAFLFADTVEILETEDLTVLVSGMGTIRAYRNDTGANPHVEIHEADGHVLICHLRGITAVSATRLSGVVTATAVALAAFGYLEV